MWSRIESKRLSPHPQDPWLPKLDMVLNQDDGAPLKKSRGTSIVWSRDKIKTIIFPQSQCRREKACACQK